MRARRQLVFSNWPLVCMAWVRMNFRRVTMSFTVAVFVPRSCITTSMKLGKVSCLLPSSSTGAASSSKMKSARSTKPTTSTSTSCRALVASGLTRIFSNSALEMCLFPSLSKVKTMSANFRFTKLTAISSFSTAATTLTTSTSTPISMFMMVRAARSTKNKKTAAKTMLSLPISLTNSPMLSRKVPRNNNVYMASPTLAK
mmetsp:Transcript_103533/g.288273  ORF Transcript_103533/g.288273 Transcript_103533/m.288273 type:complete len:200 (-) Transcript_103533:128-727(-)